MNILGFEIKKIKKEIPTTKLKIGKTEEEKILELEERKNEIELNKLKISEIKRERFKRELEEIGKRIENPQDFDDDDEEEIDEEDDLINSAFGTILTKVMAGSKGGSTTGGSSFLEQAQLTPSNSTSTPHAAPITDEEIRGYLRQQSSKNLKLAKAIPKPLLFRKIKEQMPLSNDECERAYQILVTEF